MTGRVFAANSTQRRSVLVPLQPGWPEPTPADRQIIEDNLRFEFACNTKESDIAQSVLKRCVYTRSDIG